MLKTMRLVGSYNEVPTVNGFLEFAGPDSHRRAFIFPCFTGVDYQVRPVTPGAISGLNIPPNTAALKLLYSEIGDVLCRAWEVNTFGVNTLSFIEVREMAVEGDGELPISEVQELCRLIRQLLQTGGPRVSPMRRRR